MSQIVQLLIEDKELLTFVRDEGVVLSGDGFPSRPAIRAHEDVISAHVCYTDEDSARSAGRF